LQLEATQPNGASAVVARSIVESARPGLVAKPVP
jgi:hypothetical protein